MRAGVVAARRRRRLLRQRAGRAPAASVSSATACVYGMMAMLSSHAAPASGAGHFETAPPAVAPADAPKGWRTVNDARSQAEPQRPPPAPRRPARASQQEFTLSRRAQRNLACELRRALQPADGLRHAR